MSIATSHVATRCEAIPAVTYHNRGQALRVEREGKGGHLTLNRHDGVWQVIVNGSGVVGILGYSHQSDSYCVEVYGRRDYASSTGRTADYFLAETDTLANAIGEAGLYWLS